MLKSSSMATVSPSALRRPTRPGCHLSSSSLTLTARPTAESGEGRDSMPAAESSSPQRTVCTAAWADAAALDAPPLPFFCFFFFAAAAGAFGCSASAERSSAASSSTRAAEVSGGPVAMRSGAPSTGAWARMVWRADVLLMSGLLLSA